MQKIQHLIPPTNRPEANGRVLVFFYGALAGQMDTTLNCFLGFGKCTIALVLLQCKWKLRDYICSAVRASIQASFLNDVELLILSMNLDSKYVKLSSPF